MMASAGSIFVDLLLRDSSYNQSWNNAARNTRNASGRIGKDVSGLERQFSGLVNPVKSLGSAIAQLGGIVAASLSVDAVIRYSDAFKQIEGRLSLVTSNTSELVRTQNALFEVAQKTRQPLQGITNFYSRLAQFIPEAERAQFDLLGVTQNVSAALAITGETGESASAAMIQFTQAIGTNFEAAGQELRSLQEQAPRLTQALQRALGDGTKSLQQLKEEGTLTRQSVLNALSGIGEEGRKLAEELEKIPVTVGQAFTRLDNAFLKFIGQSQLVNDGTSSIAAGISSLAENFDKVVAAVQTLAVVLTARYGASLAVIIAQQVALLASTLRLQLSLASLAGISGTAATGILAFGAATRAASAALGVFLPAAAIFAVYEFLDGNESLIESERELARVVDETSKALEENFRVHGKLTEEAKNGVKERIRAYRDEILALERVLETQLDNASNLELIGRGIKDVFGEVIIEGIGGGQYQSLEESISRQGQLRQSIRDLEGLLNEERTGASSSSSAGGVIAETLKEAEKREKKLESLYKSNRVLIEGLSAETIRYLDTAEDLKELYEAGRISEEQFNLANIRLKQQFDELNEKAEDTFLDLEAISKRASENIQDAFADFLFDPFQDGLDGMLLGFVDTKRKMLAEQAASSLLKTIAGSALGGVLNYNLGTGSLGSQVSGSISSNPDIFGSSNFGGFYADGGYLEPGKWGIAGEEGAEMIYGGKTGATVIPNKGMGGNTYNIDARGADEGAVRRMESALLSLAGPGQIEKRVQNAQRRGSL